MSNWDPTKHPRKPAGSPEGEGGEFVTRQDVLSNYDLRGDPADYTDKPQAGWKGNSHKTGVWIHKNPMSLWYEGGMPGSAGVLGTLSRNATDAKRIAIREAADKVKKAVDDFRLSTPPKVKKSVSGLTIPPKFKPKR